MAPHQDPHRRLITLAYFAVVVAALFGLLAWHLGKNGLVAPAVCGVIGGVVSWAFRHAIAAMKYRRHNLAEKLNARHSNIRWRPKQHN